MRFLFVGNGFIAPKHKEAIKEINGEIIGIVEEKDDWQKEIKKTDADCVVILTPNDLHFEMTMLAAEQGKIVLCEKPLVIKSEHAKILAGKQSVYTVSQLRYHPYIEKIRSEQLAKNIKHNIQMNIYFKRDDENYIRGWKNRKERSGGFLFNLGIHYFDLLLYLFGDAKRIEASKIYEKNDENPKAEGKGQIEGENYVCDWQMCINKKEDGEIIKKREFIINGKSYNFSTKDNLAEENLHKFVYYDLLNGKGITPKGALPAIELVEKIYQSYRV